MSQHHAHSGHAEHPEHPGHAGHPEQPTVERHCDVAVVGGSAAGLAAALQLVRQRRTVVVVDDGSPRNAPAAHMHGYLGREGASPAELVAVGREEVRQYGGEVLTGRVVTVLRDDDGSFRLELTGGHRVVARRVVLATGIVDELPAIEGLAEHWGRDVVHCPFCHGYEVRDRRVVQVVTHPMGLHPTTLLRHLTDRLTVVLHDVDGADEDTLTLLEAGGVRVVRTPVRRVETGPDGHLSGVVLTDGERLEAEAVLVGPRFHPRTDAVAALGVTPSPHPSGLGEVVEVDGLGQTSAPGVYAAGNVTDPSLQVLPSAAMGSRVGAMVAFSLADDDLRADARPSADRADWESRYAGEEHVWSANPNGTLVAEVRDLPPGRALDVGAGEGADALWLTEQGWEVTATDLSGNALARVGAEAARRGLDVRLRQADASAAGAFGTDTYDLVSLQYGSFRRTPEQHGLRNLVGAVAPGGTLLVVGHDLTPMLAPVDVAEHSWMFDPGAYVGVEEVAAALADADGWEVQVHETRPRPAGAASTHHVEDVVLRAVRRG